MKSLQELYKEVIASEELKKEFLEVSKDEKSVVEFMKKYGCEATFDELKAFFEEKNNSELDEDEVEAVAGGKGKHVTTSIITMGTMCLYHHFMHD